MRLLPLLLLFTGAVPGQTPPTAGSISGQVINAATGLPVAGAHVSVRIIGKANVDAVADQAGRYIAHDLPPGAGIVETDAAGSDSRNVTLHAGEDLTSIDLRIRPEAKISGKVMDVDGKPLSNMSVNLIAREYRWGSLRYFYVNSALTDAHGQFHLEDLEPGRGYLLSVSSFRQFDPAIESSDARITKDPKKRKPVITTTFYPGVIAIGAAAPIILKAGEARDDINVTVARSKSFCVDGKVIQEDDEEPLGLRVEADEPNTGIVGNGDHVMQVVPAERTIPSDGSFRVCDVPPGQWRFSVTQGEWIDAALYGTELVSVVDGDVHDLTIAPRPHTPLEGDVVQDGAADPSGDLKIRLTLLPVPLQFGGREQATATLPGHFAFDDLTARDYAVTVAGIPDGMYLKDVTYGSRSALYEPLPLGSEATGTSLRITIARDGGFVGAKATDKDGAPIPGSWITLIPVSATTEAAVSGLSVSGETDQDGIWRSGALAPGQYYVLATERQLYMTPETLTRMMVERLRHDPVEVGANATVSATAVVTTIE